MTGVSMTRSYAGLRFTLLHQVLDSRLGHNYMKLRSGYDGYRLDSQADVVIEGFPRSANTYAWYAMRRALEPWRTVRGHTHSANNVVRAVECSLPTMVLIRDPDAAVSSLVQLAQGVSVERAFRAYSSFYQACIPALPDAVLITFDDVVNRFPKVVERFYSDFALDWPVYEGTPEDEIAVRNEIDEASRRRRGGVVREVGVARPSAHRKSAREVLGDLSVREARSREVALAVHSECIAAFAASLE